jgi:hypothetical protein
MNRFRRFPVFLALCCVLLVLAGVSITLARAVSQEFESSEEQAVAVHGQLVSAELIGDDPDEDGYTGTIPAPDDAGVDPSETDPAVAGQIDWGLFGQEPQPDEDDGAITSNAVTDIMAWSNFRYINVAGATMVPRSSATNWTYPGGGCISASVANDVFNIHLAIPNGSRIEYLRLYYYDASASNSTAWVTTYNGAGVATDRTSVSSTGNAGYGTTLSPYVGHVVNTADNGYVLNWRANQTGSTMRLCGLRVAYRTPQ